MPGNKDELFRQERELVPDFDFSDKTAEVFDDMLDRSVPFYSEIQRMMGEITADFVTPGSCVYDLGCSTCASFIQLEHMVPEDVTFVGLDNSQAMLDKGQRKLQENDFSRKYELHFQDLNEPFLIQNASVVLMNLTLQFIRPLVRARTVRHIADGLNSGGVLLLIEKVTSSNSMINRLFIKYYYRFKMANGYSEMEIAQKREALENILVPYRYMENRQLLLDNGFCEVESFFRWYNFCGIIAIK
jgi:tRNA (cmo5U34)-methyltransferase